MMLPKLLGSGNGRLTNELLHVKKEAATEDKYDCTVVTNGTFMGASTLQLVVDKTPALGVVEDYSVEMIEQSPPNLIVGLNSPEALKSMSVYGQNVAGFGVFTAEPFNELESRKIDKPSHSHLSSTSGNSDVETIILPLVSSDDAPVPEEMLESLLPLIALQMRKLNCQLSSDFCCNCRLPPLPKFSKICETDAETSYEKGINIKYSFTEERASPDDLNSSNVSSSPKLSRADAVAFTMHLIRNRGVSTLSASKLRQREMSSYGVTDSNPEFAQDIFERGCEWLLDFSVLCLVQSIAKCHPKLIKPVSAVAFVGIAQRYDFETGFNVFHQESLDDPNQRKLSAYIMGQDISNSAEGNGDIGLCSSCWSSFFYFLAKQLRSPRSSLCKSGLRSCGAIINLMQKSLDFNCFDDARDKNGGSLSNRCKKQCIHIHRHILLFFSHILKPLLTIISGEKKFLAEEASRVITAIAYTAASSSVIFNEMLAMLTEHPRKNLRLAFGLTLLVRRTIESLLCIDADLADLSMRNEQTLIYRCGNAGKENEGDFQVLDNRIHQVEQPEEIVAESTVLGLDLRLSCAAHALPLLVNFAKHPAFAPRLEAKTAILLLLQNAEKVLENNCPNDDFQSTGNSSLSSCIRDAQSTSFKTNESQNISKCIDDAGDNCCNAQVKQTAISLLLSLCGSSGSRKLTEIGSVLKGIYGKNRGTEGRRSDARKYIQGNGLSSQSSSAGIFKRRLIPKKMQTYSLCHEQELNVEDKIYEISSKINLNSMLPVGAKPFGTLFQKDDIGESSKLAVFSDLEQVIELDLCKKKRKLVAQEGEISPTYPV